jgi:hypothetical protein
VKLKRGSYGPEFHIVEPEPLDGNTPGVVSPVPDIPEKRLSTNAVRR